MLYFERAFFMHYGRRPLVRKAYLLIDHFYCLHSTPSCAQSNYGAEKSCAFDQAAALGLLHRNLLGGCDWEHTVPKEFVHIGAEVLDKGNLSKDMLMWIRCFILCQAMTNVPENHTLD